MYKYLISMLCVVNINAQIIGAIAVIVEEKAITVYDVKKEVRVSKVNPTVAIGSLIRKKLEEVEIEKRSLIVNATEVYEDIKTIATSNNMSVSEFYKANLNEKGLNSSEVKKKIKEKLLTMKLYNAISYSKLTNIKEKELKEYFELHKDTFLKAESFDTVIYQTTDRNALVHKIQNPMSYSPAINTSERILPYEKLAPKLAQLLLKTPLNTFTQIIPDGRNTYMSIYLKSIKKTEDIRYEDQVKHIKNTLMSQKREKILTQYFAKLRHNADIKVLRALDEIY